MLSLSTSVYSQSWRHYDTSESASEAADPNQQGKYGALAGPRGVTSRVASRLISDTPLDDVQEEADDPALRRKFRILRILNLALMSLCIVGYGMCISLFAPFFPTEAQQRGISATVVGFIFATFTFVMFIGSLVASQLVRQLSLGFMVASGTVLAGGSTLLFGVLDMAPAGDAYVVLCFAIRLIEGCGACLYNTAAYSIAAQLYPQDIATVYAILEASCSVGKMIGPSFGGMLYGIGGFPLPFYVIGGLLLVFGTISQVVMRVTMSEDAAVASSNAKRKPGKKRPPPKHFPLSYFFRHSLEIWILSIGLCLAGVVFGFPSPTLSVYLGFLGMTDPAAVGLVFLGGGLVLTLLSVFVGKLSDRYPQRVFHILVLGAFLLAVGMFFYGPVPSIQAAVPPSIGLTVASHMILCTGVAMIMNPIPSAIMLAAKKVGYEEGLELSALIAGLYNAQWFAGQCAGNPLAGVLVDSIGFAWGAFVLSIVSVFIMCLFATAVVLQHVANRRAGRGYDMFFDSETCAAKVKDEQQPIDALYAAQREREKGL